MAVAESETSSLHTLTDSIRESLYTTRGSRRFQGVNDDYRWPCDSAASTLEMLAALAYENAYPNGLYFEPIEGELEERFASSDEPVRILDLGSGLTAMWAISMAERFPRAEVIGIDLTPSELTYLPPNLTIEIHDLLEGLPFPDDYFDLIHCRFGRTSGFLTNPHLDFIDAIARALKPGGVLLLEGNDPDSEALHSRFPHCPVLDAIRTRQKARAENARILRPPSGYSHLGSKEATPTPTPTTRVREHPAFAASVHTTCVDFPIGYRSDTSTDRVNQIGTIVREGYLLFEELQNAAAGFDEGTIRELRVVDQLTLPEHDVGLSIRSGVVWAVKAKVEGGSEDEIVH